MTKQILLTGNEGFIGQNVQKKLEGQGKKVIGLERLNYFSPLSSQIDWKNIEEVWHLGAVTNTTETNLWNLVTYNIQFSLDLFNIANAHKIPIKYTSSASIFGNSKDYSINPLNQYAMSKAWIDLWIGDHFREFHKINIYRLFNVYGDGEEHKGLMMSPVSNFIRQAKEYKVIKLFYSSDEMERDFIWVGDVVECMLEDRPSGFYDLGTSRVTSFEDIAQMVSEKYNCMIQHISMPNNLHGKYQYFTKARPMWKDYPFRTVHDYINKHT